MKKPTIIFVLVLLFSLSVVWPLQAQTPAPAKPSGPLAVKAGKVLDVRTGQVATNVYILVEQGKITSLGPTAPAGVPVLDLSNKTILPGLIDCHVHLLLNWNDQSSASFLRMSSPQAALWGWRNLQVYLEKGFTTLRDAGETDALYGQFALRDSVKSNLIQGPRLVCAGSFVSVTGGHGDLDSLAPDFALKKQVNIADTVDEVAIVVRRDLKYGTDWIKLMATGGVADPLSDFNVQELSQEQMAKAVEIAHRARRKVMAHAEGTEGIKAAVRAGVDSIEHGTMLDEEGAVLMAKQGTWLVPTLYTFQHGVEAGLTYNQDPIMLEKGKAILKYQQPAFALALKHRLKIAFGDDDDPAFAPKEFSALVRGGMTPLEALQTATVNGAELLGLSAEIGTIEAGKTADLIAVEGDPLKDITVMENVVFVMKQGAIIKQPKKD
ncbi:MAG: amidohydrolase family protein [Blastocatellia bacterium]|nr:amidohydrolase family protein [Blastocatellia bacterium]